VLNRTDVAVSDEFQQVYERFPAATEKIKWLAQNSEDFHRICLDYKECVEARDNLQKTLHGAEDFLEEFKELLQGLEEEILPWLEIDQKLQHVLDLVRGDKDRAMLMVRHNPCFRELCKGYAERLEAASSSFSDGHVVPFPPNLRDIENQVRLWL
jgi:hypothetical protein